MTATTALPHDAAWLKALATRRRSCRRFLGNPVDETLVESALSVAGQAPSWSNTQPWKVYVGSRETTARFSEALFEHVVSRGKRGSDIPTPHEYAEPYNGRRRETGHGLYETLGIAREDKKARSRQALENFRLFGAPHVMIVTSPVSLGTYGAIDTGGFVNLLLMAFEAHGLGAIAQGALAEYGSFVRTFFDIPEDLNIICGVAFGYADQDDPVNLFRTNRAKIGEIAIYV